MIDEINNLRVNIFSSLSLKIILQILHKESKRSMYNNIANRTSHRPQSPINSNCSICSLLYCNEYGLDRIFVALSRSEPSSACCDDVLHLGHTLRVSHPNKGDWRMKRVYSRINRKQKQMVAFITLFDIHGTLYRMTERAWWHSCLPRWQPYRYSCVQIRAQPSNKPKLLRTAHLTCVDVFTAL